MIRACLFAAVLAAAACGQASGLPENVSDHEWTTGDNPHFAPPQSVRGLLLFGYEDRAFFPCDQPTSWWIDLASLEATGGDDLFERMGFALENGDVLTLFAEGSARISRAGKFGHMGNYDRLIWFTLIEEIEQPENCEIEGYAFD